MSASCSRRATGSAGRNWTIGRGATIEMTDGTRQRCEFDTGQYWNSGPARIPSHHQTVLGYCRELDVALEVEVNTSRTALLLNPTADDGRPIEMRRAITMIDRHRRAHAA